MPRNAMAYKTSYDQISISPQRLSTAFQMFVYNQFCNSNTSYSNQKKI